MVKKIIFIFAAVIFAASCTPNEDSGGGGFDEFDEKKDTVSTNSTLAAGTLNEVIKSFTNPVEMAALMKDVGTSFSKKYLSPTKKIKEYDTDFKKSIGLGLLVADLGYLNIYEETGTIISYITVIKRIADDLNVGQFFDFNTLKQLAINNDNLDSLMFLSINSFNRMDDHLREHGRSNLSSLVITGVWIEGLYLATQVVKESPNAEVAERIGEQKIIIDDLFEILENFKDDTNFANLISDLSGLKEVYEGVEITYEIDDPELVEKNGVLIVIQKETSFVNMTDEQLNSIINKVEEIRNKLISL